MNAREPKKTLWVFATHASKSLTNRALKDVSKLKSHHHALFVTEDGYFFWDGEVQYKVALINLNGKKGREAVYTAIQTLDEGFSLLFDISKFRDTADKDSTLEATRQALRHCLEVHDYELIEVFSEWNLGRSGISEITIQDLVQPKDRYFYRIEPVITKHQPRTSNPFYLPPNNNHTVPMLLWLQGAGGNQAPHLLSVVEQLGCGQIMHHPAIFGNKRSLTAEGMFSTRKPKALLPIDTAPEKPYSRVKSDGVLTLRGEPIVFETEDKPILNLPEALPLFGNDYDSLTPEHIAKKTELDTHPALIPCPLDLNASPRTPPNPPCNSEANSGRKSKNTYREASSIRPSIFNNQIIEHKIFELQEKLALEEGLKLNF